MNVKIIRTSVKEDRAVRFCQYFFNAYSLLIVDWIPVISKYPKCDMRYILESYDVVQQIQDFLWQIIVVTGFKSIHLRKGTHEGDSEGLIPGI